MNFLFQEFLRGCSYPTKPIRIGFVLDVFPAPYNIIMASARLRAYDVITAFSDNPRYFLELYKPWRKYDIVIFQKAFRPKHRLTAQRLKYSHTIIVLDVNTNVFDENTISPHSKETASSTFKAFLPFVDHLIVSSPFLFERANILHTDVPTTLIEEHLPKKIFTVKKDASKKPATLIYVGYALKAAEVLHIKKILQELHKRYSFQILFLCEKNPNIHINGIECIFKRYRQSRIAQQILEGDIFIAPRDLSRPYNLGHSFSKIGLPMAVGLPIVASPIPSYHSSPALLPKNNKEWYSTLESLFKREVLRIKLSRQGREYCKTHYSTFKIMNEYSHLFKKLIQDTIR